MSVKLNMQRSVCASNFTLADDEGSLVWVSFIAIALSLFSFITILIYFYGMVGHLRKLQCLLEKRKEEERAKKKEAEDVDHEAKLMN